MPVTQQFPNLSLVADTKRSLRLGFLSPHNALDQRSFSGTVFHAFKALDAHPDISLKLLGHHHHAPGMLDRLRRFKRREPKITTADFDGIDVVVGLVATDLLDQTVQLRPDLPFLHVTDATPKFLRDTYGWAVPAEADRKEAHVAEKAALCLYSSSAVAGRAARDLSLLAMSAAHQPFGVNFQDLPEIPQQKPSTDQIELLFVGLDWERKGGDVAVAALDCLRSSGHNARLTIVGRCPERHKSHPGIDNAGFLDKNRARDARTLTALYSKSHLLLLPSRADCTPMVVAEAMAHGTPVIATDTGGIRDQIGGAGAGRLLPPHTSPKVWAQNIQDILACPDGYRLMSDAAFDRAQTHLCWTAWADAVANAAQASLTNGATTTAHSLRAVGNA